MSRDWTPRQMYEANTAMYGHDVYGIIDWFASITVSLGDEEPHKLYSDEETARRKQHPYLGALFNNYLVVADEMEKTASGKARLDEIEAELKRCVEKTTSNKDGVVNLWYNGKLDKAFYYSTENDRLFSEYILANAMP